MKKISILFLFGLLLVSCKKEIPGCLNSKIDDHKKSACTNGASVKEYSFQGNAVYVFDPGICGADMTSEVTDTECKNLGYLGGIIGNTKINGEEFSNAKFKKTVWSN